MREDLGDDGDDDDGEGDVVGDVVLDGEEGEGDGVVSEGGVVDDDDDDDIDDDDDDDDAKGGGDLRFAFGMLESDLDRFDFLHAFSEFFLLLKDDEKGIGDDDSDDDVDCDSNDDVDCDSNDDVDCDSNDDVDCDSDNSDDSTDASLAVELNNGLDGEGEPACSEETVGDTDGVGDSTGLPLEIPSGFADGFIVTFSGLRLKK